MDEEQREILVNFIRVDSEFSKELHHEFWAPMEDCSHEQKQDFSKQFSEIPSLSMAQKSQWLSIKISMEKSEVIIDPSYEDFLLVRSKWLESRAKPLDVLDKERARLVETIESVLESGSMKVEGVEVVINMELIDQILEGIDASEQRVKMLLAIPEQ